MRFQHSFNGLLFALLLREGFPTQGHGDGRPQNTQHWPDESNVSLLGTGTHSVGKKDNACHVGSQAGDILGNKVNHQRLREAGFVVPGVKIGLWFSWDDGVALFE